MLDLSADTLFISYDVCGAEQAPLFRALFFQDKTVIASYANHCSPENLRLAMRFCIQRNLSVSFRTLLTEMNSRDQSLEQVKEAKESVLIDCIKMHRVDMLGYFDSFPAVETTLRVSSLYGTPAIFSRFAQTCSKKPLPAALTVLINDALKIQKIGKWFVSIKNS